jgi:hypothetical protein
MAMHELDEGDNPAALARRAGGNTGLSASAGCKSAIIGPG